MSKNYTSVNALSLKLKSFNKQRISKRKIAFILICVIPALVLYLGIVVWPIINMFYLSLTEWGGLLGNKTFVWFDNYKMLLFDDPKFWLSFKNTLILIVMVTLVTIFLALLFASMLAKSRLKGKTFFRIVFYIPNILSIVVISAIFSTLYSPTIGIFGGIARLFDWTYTGVMGSSKTVVPFIGIAMIWQAIGYYMVMYIAGMDSISDELYESASLEGASGARKFFKITMPLTWQVIRVTLTFFIISTINMSFLFVTAMTDGEPGGTSHVLLSYMYNRSNNGVYGYAMAIGSLLFIFAYGLALIVNALTKREVIEM